MPHMSHLAFFFVACTVLLSCAGASSGTIEDVPFCTGGNRAKSCITSRMCEVTSEGCQVCRCQSLDE